MGVDSDNTCPTTFHIYSPLKSLQHRLPIDDLKSLILYGMLAGVLFASFRKTFRDPKVQCSLQPAWEYLSPSVVGQHPRRRVFWFSW
jgi:hypothetical protein